MLAIWLSARKRIDLLCRGSRPRHSLALLITICKPLMMPFSWLGGCIWPQPFVYIVPPRLSYKQVGQKLKIHSYIIYKNKVDLKKNWDTVLFYFYPFHSTWVFIFYCLSISWHIISLVHSSLLSKSFSLSFYMYHLCWELSLAKYMVTSSKFYMNL